MVRAKTHYFDFRISPYESLWILQKRLVGMKIKSDLPDFLLLGEHLPVYTLGKGADLANILRGKTFFEKKGIPFYRVERGGDVTWHGPGQMVCYPLFDLQQMGLDLYRFVYLLEEAVIETLKIFGVEGSRTPGMRGVWAKNRKVASIGVAVKGGITYHGLAININPDLSYFDWIIPCGIRGVKMCSLSSLRGEHIPLTQVKTAFLETMARLFHLDICPAEFTL